MTHTKICYEEYEVEYCDNCGHDVSSHYDQPKNIYYANGEYMYTAEGCMCLVGKRKLKGNNKYLRCECMKVK